MERNNTGQVGKKSISQKFSKANIIGEKICWSVESENMRGQIYLAVLLNQKILKFQSSVFKKAHVFSAPADLCMN